MEPGQTSGRDDSPGQGVPAAPSEARQWLGCLVRSVAYVALAVVLTKAYGPGGLFVAISLALFIMKVGVSYDTEGGSIGMVPVLDGAIFPPVFLTFGVWMCHAFPKRAFWPFWAYLLLWAGATAIATFAIVAAGNMAERGRRRHLEDRPPA